MHSSPIKVFLFTALACEAKPLIAHFALKKDLRFSAFAIYRNADCCLTVTGPGKAAMAAGVAYTLALIAKCDNPIMLNVGIAGHQSFSLGELFLAEKITDVDSGKNYYPQLVYKAPCATAYCCSVSKPDFSYDRPVLYDMEASAFYETAVRFTSSELIQCLKVVSDNQQTAAAEITEKQVSQWLAAAIVPLEKLVQVMQMLLQSVDQVDLEFYQTCIDTWRFTASERVKLKNLLLRWSALMSGRHPILNEKVFNKGKEVLLWLETELDKVDFRL